MESRSQSNPVSHTSICIQFDFVTSGIGVYLHVLIWHTTIYILRKFLPQDNKMNEKHTYRQ